MREFWYNYVKPKYGENAALQTASFIVYVKIDDIFKGISEDFKQDLTLQTLNQTDHCLKEK